MQDKLVLTGTCIRVSPEQAGRGCLPHSKPPFRPCWPLKFTNSFCLWSRFLFILFPKAQFLLVCSLTYNTLICNKECFFHSDKLVVKAFRCSTKRGYIWYQQLYAVWQIVLSSVRSISLPSNGPVFLHSLLLPFLVLFLSLFLSFPPSLSFTHMH